MIIKFTDVSIKASNEICKKAAEMFAEEIKIRTAYKPEISNMSAKNASFEFVMLDNKNSEYEGCKIETTDSGILLYASRLRGFIYAYSMILRKAEFKNSTIILPNNLNCCIEPDMKIRGHQLGYSDTSNTYDAWDKAMFKRYIRDMMFFGLNTVEAVFYPDEKVGPLMRYSQKEVIEFLSDIAVELDIDFYIWQPVFNKQSNKEIISIIKNTYINLPKLNTLFIPGGDPGDMQAEAFTDRCVLIKQTLKSFNVDAEVWISAQAPHEYPDWGERLAEKLKSVNDIDGVIYGPNHALPLDELRRALPERYRLRFYPDITHNVRCEYPVHFDKNDWAYEWASTMGRESINPRPLELRKLHKLTKGYFCGSVSYSEGINDDINKMIFSELDFNCNADIAETLCDYSRAFFYGMPYDVVCSGILGLEKNWITSAKNNPYIENTYLLWENLKKEFPEFLGNYRFVLCLFRATADYYVKARVEEENNIIDNFRYNLYLNNNEKAKEILFSSLKDETANIRTVLYEYAENLFKNSGMQLDTTHFFGKSWERGCTIDTIDKSITDLEWIRNCYLKAEKLDNTQEYMKDVLNRRNVESDEYIFSFAIDGFDICGEQSGEYYMEFIGDTPENDGKLPMSVMNVYDHYNFACSAAGLTGGNYILKIIYKQREFKDANARYKITVNGNVVYDGAPVGGEADTVYDDKYLSGSFFSKNYSVKKEFIVNGCANIEITEPTRGFLIAEILLKKA